MSTIFRKFITTFMLNIWITKTIIFSKYFMSNLKILNPNRSITWQISIIIRNFLFRNRLHFNLNFLLNRRFLIFLSRRPRKSLLSKIASNHLSFTHAIILLILLNLKLLSLIYFYLIFFLYYFCILLFGLFILYLNWFWCLLFLMIILSLKW